jgi:curved DNA-binding protein CbpA
VTTLGEAETKVSTDESDDNVLAWFHVLDDLSYYELFGVAHTAPVDEIHSAFHVFCDTFHPDRHVPRPGDERDVLLAVFKRGTEAYAVLSDAALRGQYDEQLAHGPAAHPPRLTFSPLSRPPPSVRPSAGGAVEDFVRTSAARPFARRADELLRKGDLRQAKLQLVMANHMDPGNEVLESALKDLEQKLGSPK